jgi:hypothetical protein
MSTKKVPASPILSPPRPLISLKLTTQASNLRRNVPNPLPIPTGKIFKKAALIALTFGIVGLCCAECVADVDAPANNGGGGGGQVVDQQMGVQPMMQPPPMPSGNVGMDWTPVSNAAQSGVQG